ncbi:MAG: formate/nitrite transporter family protein [Deltaproteobacteria bacterium]|jgi:formate/nitrite transporter|nr:formate/nitrite transporter family protein [Deltaproteobacteria bacterium]
MLTPVEIVQYYAEAGAKKCAAPGLKLLLLGILAGFLIGMGSAVTNTATHSIESVGVARMVAGLLFPFGLGIVILTGAELFTGNCMIPVSLAEGKAGCFHMLRNWFWVYFGNFIGAALLAAACAYSGQLDHSGGYLAVYTMKVAAAKCGLSFWSGVVLGILCNLLVCLGVLCSFSAKDTTGRILGAYIPVAFFVICGFEHCVANMYYIPAAIFASYIPEYAAQAAALGVQSTFTWGEFIVNNLIPVTIGNIIAGAMVIMLLWAAHWRRGKA